MKHKHNFQLVLLGLIAFGGIIFGCKSEPQEVEKPQVNTYINPNGESELASLMKAMLADAKVMREHIEQGVKPKSDVDYAAILTSEATEPDKAESDVFKSYATAYIQIMERMESANRQEKEELYQDMVNNCMNCHSLLCPGPKTVIERLDLNYAVSSSLD